MSKYTIDRNFVNLYGAVENARLVLKESEAAYFAARQEADELNSSLQVAWLEGRGGRRLQARVNAAAKAEAEAEADYNAAKAAVNAAMVAYNTAVQNAAAEEAAADVAVDKAIAVEKAAIANAKKAATSAPITGEAEEAELKKVADKQVRRSDANAKKAANKKAEADRRAARAAKKAEKPAEQKPAEKPEIPATRKEKEAAKKEAEAAIEVADAAEKKAIIADRLKERIPTLRKDARSAVVEILFGSEFDAIESLTADELKKISGIGDKFAEAILADRWYFADRLIFAEEYTVAEKAKVARIRQREVEFNPNYDPKKDKAAEMIFAKDIATGEGEVHRMLKRNGFDPYDVMITVIGIIDSTDRPKGRIDLQKAVWSKWTHKGFTARGGKLFKPLYHGTNGGRYGKVIFVREDVFDLVREFARNGARDVVKATEAKEAAYMGLVNPGTMAFAKHFGFTLKPERVAIVKSWKKVFENQRVDFVNVKTGEVKLDVDRDVIENMFDGFALIDPSAATLAKMTPEEKEIWRKSSDATLRAPYCKGLGVRALFHAVLRILGVTYIDTENNGPMKVEDIDLIADESFTKCKFGEDGHFINWAAYCKNFERLNHQFCVLITEHEDRLHSLPNQQMQALIGAKPEDIQELIDNEIKLLNGYKDKDRAASLLGGEMSKIVRAVPGLHRHQWVQDREQSAYDSKNRQALAAALHNLAHYLFFGKDPIAMLQHIAWACSDRSAELQAEYPNEADYAVGAIEADTVVCRVAKDDGMEAVLSRNPSTDAQAQVLVKVVKTFGEWDKYIPYSTTCYVSARSYTATRVRGDHDGDHVFLCFVKALVRMAKAANEFTGGRLIDWDAPETEKHLVTLDSMCDYFGGLTEQSQLGHFCDLLTSLVGYGTAKYDHAVACWLVMAVNVFVDAAKHGKGAVNVPDFVLDFLAVKNADGTVMMDDRGNRVMRPMPIYAMQGKDNQHPTRKDKRVGSKRCCTVLAKGNGDIVYRQIWENTDRKLTVDLTGVEKFNVNELLYDFEGNRNGGKSFGLRGCDELFAAGEYNEETGKREGQGLWLTLCYERVADLKAVADENADDDAFAYNEARRSTEYLRRYMAIKRLNDWAAMNGKTLEDVYDAITFWTWAKIKAPVRYENEDELAFNKRKVHFDIRVDGWAKMLGGMALRAIYQRKALVELLGVTVAEADGMDIDDSFMDGIA